MENNYRMWKKTKMFLKTLAIYCLEIVIEEPDADYVTWSYARYIVEDLEWRENSKEE